MKNLGKVNVVRSQSYGLSLKIVLPLICVILLGINKVNAQIQVSNDGKYFHKNKTLSFQNLEALIEKDEVALLYYTRAKEYKSKASTNLGVGLLSGVVAGATLIGVVNYKSENLLDAILFGPIITIGGRLIIVGSGIVSIASLANYANATRKHKEYTKKSIDVFNGKQIELEPSNMNPEMELGLVKYGIGGTYDF